MSLSLFKYLSPALALWLAFSSCAPQTLDSGQMLKIAGKEKMPVPGDYPGAEGVYLYQNLDTRLVFDKEWRATAEERYHQAIVYFNGESRELLSPELYLGRKDKLVQFTARIVKPGGGVVSFTEEHLKPVAVPAEVAALQNGRHLRLEFTDVVPGAVLEYRYKIKRYRRSIFTQVWRIQSPLPKLYTRYSLEFPVSYLARKKGWTFAPVNTRLREATIKTHTRKTDRLEYKTQSYSWEVRDVPPLIREQAMPPFDDVARYMRIDSKYKNWNQLARRYRELIAPVLEPENKAAIGQLARKIAGDADSKRGQIRLIHHYLREKYSYVPLELGADRLIPRPAEEILAGRHADGKDFSALAVLLLRALDIEAWPALVKTADKGRSPESVVGFDFNQMITLARDEQGKAYWLDFSSAGTPPGRVSPRFEGTRPLVLYPDGKGVFKKIPVSRMKDNRLTREMTLTVDDRGKIAGRVSLTLSGSFNQEIRNRLGRKGNGDTDRLVRDYLRKHFSLGDIGNLTYSDPRETEESFRIGFSTTLAPAEGTDNGTLSLNPAPFKTDERLDGFAAADRRFPVVFDTPFSVRDIIKIGFDRKGYAIDRRPTGESMRQPFGHARSRVDFGEDGTLTYTIDYGISRRRIDLSDYEDFRALLQTLRAAHEKRLVLRQR